MDGWARSLKYAENLKKYIRNYRLTDYDWKALSGVNDGLLKVEVKISNLCVRRRPGTDYLRTGQYSGKGIFEVTEVRTGKGSVKGWGRLADGRGWISMDYAVLMNDCY